MSRIIGVIFEKPTFGCGSLLFLIGGVIVLWNRSGPSAQAEAPKTEPPSAIQLAMEEQHSNPSPLPTSTGKPKSLWKKDAQQPADGARQPTAQAEGDGTDAANPTLPAADQGFVDKRGGWGWGDKCWLNIKAGKLGWAKAECLAGMALHPASPTPRAPLLFNLGVIEQKSDNLEAARKYFEQSLALREHPTIRSALNSLPR